MNLVVVLDIFSKEFVSFLVETSNSNVPKAYKCAFSTT